MEFVVGNEFVPYRADYHGNYEVSVLKSDRLLHFLLGDLNMPLQGFILGMMQNHAAFGNISLAILGAQDESVFFVARIGEGRTHGIESGFHGHIPCGRFAGIPEGKIKIQMRTNFIEDKSAFYLNMIHYNPRSFAGHKQFPVQPVGFDSGVNNGLSQGDLIGASRLDLLYEIAGGAPKKPGGNSENNGKNRNYAISVGVDQVANAKAIADK
ncbi:MAG TPA: hypothetical protein VM144_10430 [Aestuariivirga sp.]|nr:hypothetical protein [Aestuariivirga sp.]